MFESYQAGDGGWVFVLAGNSRRNSVQLVKALGIYDRLLAEGMVDAPPYPDLTRPNNLQDIDGLSKEWKLTLRERMAAAFREQPAAAWPPIMRRFGVPFTVHRTTQEWLQRPETDAAALTVEVQDPVHGTIRQLGVQTSLGRTDPRWHVPRPARPAALDALLADSAARAQRRRTVPTLLARTPAHARRPSWRGSRCSTCPPCSPVRAAPAPWRSTAPR